MQAALIPGRHADGKPSVARRGLSSRPLDQALLDAAARPGRAVIADISNAERAVQ